MNKIHKTTQTWQTPFGAPILAILITLFCFGKANAQCPTITFANTIAGNGTVGTAYTLNASATTTSGTLIYTVSPALPAGLVLNTIGQITGTPTVATATVSYIVTARTSNTCIATQSYTFIVGCPSIVISPVGVANGTVGTGYFQTITQTGLSGTIAWSISSGALPAGLNFNTATGVISGTPTASGPFLFGVTVGNGSGCTDTKAYSITVAACPTITFTNTVATNSLLATFYTLNASATTTSGTLSYTVSPALPAGLALSATTGQITGVATSPTASASYIVTARTSTTCSVTQSYTFAVVSPSAGCPTITFANTVTANGTVGVAYTLNASATATSGTLSYIVTTALPPGLVLNSATGQIAGVPTAPTLPASYTIIARTSSTCSASQSYIISIVPASGSCPTITFANTIATNGTVGTAYTLNASATATSGTLGYTVLPALPAGLALNATTGQITGVPTVAVSASYSVIARTSTTCSVTQSYTFAVVSPSAGCPTITFANAIATNGTVGTAYTLNASATTTSGTLGYTVSPALPAGLVLDATTGQITGTPTVSLSANYVVTARTSSTCSLDKIYSIIINAVSQNPTTAIDNALANLVKVSPNPSKGDFNIDFGTINMAKSSVRVYDAQGKVVFTSENNTSASGNLMVISLEKFANGIYLMEVGTSKGRILKRLAKQ